MTRRREENFCLRARARARAKSRGVSISLTHGIPACEMSSNPAADLGLGLKKSLGISEWVV